MNYKTKTISQVTKEDSRVAVIGKVLEVSDSHFILQDDATTTEVFSDIPAEKDKLVRVYCSVIQGQLKADLIQDLTGFDLTLFKKVEELYNKAGV
ncbi:MAG: hypothetical protein HY361_04390 [Candidatus Aenigmarchaeota archaeon]|nr:hypothetical protein [Candidatus Aenigmarchaeota archaeon]